MKAFGTVQIMNEHKRGVSAATGLTLLVLLSAAIIGCTASPPPTGTPSIDAVLRSDPRFTDFVDVIDFAGLSKELKGGRDMTVFAPTNAAFTWSDPNWRAWAMPQTNLDSPESHQARQTLVEAAGIRGVHPAAEFAGKLQDVQNIGGTVFHVDGRVPGVITISSGASASGGMGSVSAPKVFAQLQLPPLQTADGLIYPANGIVVPIAGAQ